MDKQDEKRVRQIAREEVLKCFREETARRVFFKWMPDLISGESPDIKKRKINEYK